jgi:hypothetical protein
MQTIARAVRGNKARAHRTQITLANEAEVTRTGTLKRLHGTMISIYLSIYLSERNMRIAHKKKNSNNKKKRASKRKDRETEPGVPCTC